jgi:alginate O-acetyltransferase complex protein AlgI
LSLIAFSSTIDYLIGLRLDQTQKVQTRKTLLSLSLIVNLGLLGFFKYYNFFVDNFVQAFTFFGQKPDINTLNIILPVGISFYTFQTLSYTIDIYRKQLKATKDPIAFFAFVSFFPQLVAGPIERAANLLPQFSKKFIFNYDDAKDGTHLILWGLFKKIVIADTCAIYANEIFESPEAWPTSVLLLGAVYFTFQIYGDFSGYSDIAIGTAKLFGFKLMRNFAYPYFSRDIAEFWRRWHISLSTWFRDYLYIPLGGSRVGQTKAIRNIFAIFLVSGFWHGANWTFLFWGLLNALYFLPSFFRNKNRKNLGIVAENRNLPTFQELIQMLSTFALAVFAWIFFRANSISDAFLYISEMFKMDIMPSTIYMWKMFRYVPLILLLIVWEWTMRKHWHGLAFNDKVPVWLRWGLYFFLCYLILFFFGQEQEFIYFQF